MKRCQFRGTFCWLVLLLVAIPFPAAAIHVSPDTIKISATYNGQEIAVTGEIGGDEEAVVQIVGDSSRSEFKQKGKVGGLLWMTVGHVSISNAPTAYLVCLPKAIQKLRDSGDPAWTKLGIGFSALADRIEIEPEATDRAKLFKDFIKLKTEDNLYQIVTDGIRYTKDPEGDKEFKATIRIPPKMAVATYDVNVLRVKGGKIVGKETSTLSLEETGFPALISRLAYEHSLVYGILSVMIAVLAGLFMGVLFRDKGGGAH